jgi:hypothetical protein
MKPNSMKRTRKRMMEKMMTLEEVMNMGKMKYC